MNAKFDSDVLSEKVHSTVSAQSKLDFQSTCKVDIKLRNYQRPVLHGLIPFSLNALVSTVNEFNQAPSEVKAPLDFVYLRTCLWNREDSLNCVSPIKARFLIFLRSKYQAVKSLAPNYASADSI